jgi:hypothetical protein
LIAQFISLDGESTWLEGSLQPGAYAIVGLAFFLTLIVQRSVSSTRRVTAGPSIEFASKIPQYHNRRSFYEIEIRLG